MTSYAIGTGVQVVDFDGHSNLGIISSSDGDGIVSVLYYDSSEGRWRSLSHATLNTDGVTPNTWRPIAKQVVTVGTAIQYTDVSLAHYPGQVFDFSGTDVAHVSFWNGTTWAQSTDGLVRDDTQTTANSWTTAR